MTGPVASLHTRAMLWLDALSSAIAGFALLAGGRLFAFAALVSLRSPVLGAAGLVLLALVGWARWFWLSRAELAPFPRQTCAATLSRNNRNDRLL
ncbi:hypothetical protein [Trinickia violacea]|uniref:hypothetical protein n=1 Tax=Trinickia violacea TaxID=2571746 RepID=UPI0020C7BD4D|nr:hypothetical protein [Trinickia violacea]